MKKFFTFFFSLFTFSISHYCVHAIAQINKADSLKAELQKEHHDTTLITLLNSLAWEISTSNLDTAITLSARAKKLAEEINSSTNKLLARKARESIAQSCHNLGRFMELRGDYKTSLEYYQHALAIWEELENLVTGERNPEYSASYSKLKLYYQKRKSATLGNIGIVYWNQGNYPKTLSYYFKALEIDSVSGNKKGIATKWGNIGIVYWNQGNYKKALSYYFKALEMDSVLGNKRNIATHLSNIGVIYFEQGDYSQALSYYFRALEMDSILGNINGIARHLGNIGIVYMNQGDTTLVQPKEREPLFSKALSYLLRSLELNKELGNKNGIVAWHGKIGSLYTKTGEYNNAEEYLKKAVALSNEIGTLKYSLDFEKLLSEMYYKWAAGSSVSLPLAVARLENAYLHRKAYTLIKDSLFNEEKSKETGRVEIMHEVEMQNYRQAQEEAVARQQESAVARKRHFLQYSGMVLVLGILLLTLLYSKRLTALLPEKIGIWKVNKSTFSGSVLFIAAFLFFETMLVAADPYIESVTNSRPFYMMLINSAFACIFYGMHTFFERLLLEKMKIRNLKWKEDSDSGTGFSTDITGGSGTILFLLICTSVFLQSYRLVPDNSFYPSTQQFGNSNPKIDSIQNKLRHTKADTQKVNLWNALAREVSAKDEKQLLKYINEGFELAEESHFEKGKAKLYKTMGIFYYNNGNYPAALENYQKALKIDSMLDHKTGIIAHLGNIGVIYKEQGDYPKALSYYFRALEMDSVLGNQKGIARHLGNIGAVYYNQGETTKALTYFFKAKEMDSLMGNKRGLAIRLGNIGSVFLKQSDYPKALSYFYKALEIDSIIENKSGISTDLGNIGIVYRKVGNYPKAIFYYSKALKIDSILGNKKGIIINLGNIGVFYSKNKEYRKAEEFLKKAVALADSIGTLQYTMNFEQNISELYYEWAKVSSVNSALAVVHLKNSYQHHLAYEKAKDSIFSEEKGKEIGRLEMKHEIEMAEMKNRLIAEAKAKKEAEIKSSRNLMEYTVAMILIALLLVTVTFFVRFTLPESVSEFLVFFTFIMFFELVLVFLNTYINAYSAGEPATKLFVNMMVALLIYPLHHFLESRMKARIFKNKPAGYNA